MSNNSGQSAGAGTTDRSRRHASQQHYIIPVLLFIGACRTGTCAPCRVQELTATCKAQQQLTAALASRSTATALPRDQDDDAGAAAGPALEQLLQAASTAQAELAVARRRLAQLEQRVAAARADSVQAEFRAQGSQLRVTTVRRQQYGLSGHHPNATVPWLGLASTALDLSFVLR